MRSCQGSYVICCIVDHSQQIPNVLTLCHPLAGKDLVLLVWRGERLCSRRKPSRTQVEGVLITWRRNEIAADTPKNIGGAMRSHSFEQNGNGAQTNHHIPMQVPEKQYYI